MLKVFLN